MKYERTERFKNDYRRLSDEEKQLVKAFLSDFVAAAELVAADPRHRWPTTLRVKNVQGVRGVMEVTWSFAGPDGRATFEWASIEGEQGIRWRRIGGHEVFREP